MKIEIIKNWVGDEVYVMVDGEERGRVYSESVSLVADELTRIVSAIAPADAIIAVKEA